MLKSVKTKQFKRFMKFNNWYTNMIGRFLTPDEIDLTFPKFETNGKKRNSP